MRKTCQPNPPPADLPRALRADLADEATNLIVAMTEAVLAAGLGFKGPYEEFGRVVEELVLDALGSARRDGAQLAQSQAAANDAWTERLALLYSDGSLSVAAASRNLESVRREAIEADDYELDPGQYTKVGRVRVEVIEEIATPSAETGNSPGERFAKGTLKQTPIAPKAADWRDAEIHAGAVLPNGQTAATLVWPFKDPLSIPSRVKITRA